jgi:acyl dehydratase
MSTLRRILVLADLPALIGQELVVSDWANVSQAQVDQFAQATGDCQWIHVDPERAARGPFGGTIAHGFMTVSLIPKLVFSALAFEGEGITINYGLNRLRFPAPLRVGSRVRARAQLTQVLVIDDKATQIAWNVTVECQGQAKPVCMAECLLRHLAPTPAQSGQ